MEGGNTKPDKSYHRQAVEHNYLGICDNVGMLCTLLAYLPAVHCALCTGAVRINNVLISRTHTAFPTVHVVFVTTILIQPIGQSWQRNLSNGLPFPYRSRVISGVQCLGSTYQMWLPNSIVSTCELYVEGQHSTSIYYSKYTIHVMYSIFMVVHQKKYYA